MTPHVLHHGRVEALMRSCEKFPTQPILFAVLRPTSSGWVTLKDRPGCPSLPCRILIESLLMCTVLEVSRICKSDSPKSDSSISSSFTPKMEVLKATRRGEAQKAQCCNLTPGTEPRRGWEIPCTGSLSKYFRIQPRASRGLVYTPLLWRHCQEAQRCSKR